MEEINHYELLELDPDKYAGVSPSDSVEDPSNENAKILFSDLVNRAITDLTNGLQEGQSMTAEEIKAEETLLDPQKKLAYDNELLGEKKGGGASLLSENAIARVKAMNKKSCSGVLMAAFKDVVDIFKKFSVTAADKNNGEKRVQSTGGQWYANFIEQKQQQSQGRQ